MNLHLHRFRTPTKSPRGRKQGRRKQGISPELKDVMCKAFDKDVSKEPALWSHLGQARRTRWQRGSAQMRRARWTIREKKAGSCVLLKPRLLSHRQLRNPTYHFPLPKVGGSNEKHRNFRKYDDGHCRLAKPWQRRHILH